MSQEHKVLTERTSLDLPTVNAPVLSGVIRQQAEDFRVDEIPSIQPSGSGEHIWLKVRKVNTNTDWLAGQLARIANIKKRDVGYAGLKDRHAVTTQWFSLYLSESKTHSAPNSPHISPSLPNWAAHLPPEVSILEETRHTRKLRTGTLHGNQFDVLIRDCQPLAPTAAPSYSPSSIHLPTLLNERLALLTQQGVPNYFGEQRFGKGLSNIHSASAWFAGEFEPKKRHLQSVYLSAARSWLFNQMVAARIAQQTYSSLLAGEVFMLAGSHSWFYEPLSDDLCQRYQQGDIHPTAALWGKGPLASRAIIADLEQHIAQQYSLLARGLEQQSLTQDRRAIRLMLNDLQHSWQSPQQLRLRFSLPAGAFATAVLKEIMCY
ncbi:MAG: tRNA pseudouridine(13) synthase TruD [bacterium]